ncbi:MAG: hypothetical protein R3C28_00010 [Pirellulaceae bacterium]
MKYKKNCRQPVLAPPVPVLEDHPHDQKTVETLAFLPLQKLAQALPTPDWPLKKVAQGKSKGVCPLKESALSNPTPG